MRPLSIAALAAIAAFCALPLALHAGLRINITSSFPPGLYWVVDKVPERGDLVLFCPPRGEVFDLAYERGYLASGTCPSGYMRMLKRLVGDTGDEIVIKPEGVRVNGRLQMHSQVLTTDLRGRPMPKPDNESFQLKLGQVLMLSDYSGLSFDARYFGSISRGQLLEVVRPLLVREKVGVDSIASASP